MKTWFKYAVAFFSFVILLTAFIFIFGPGYRNQMKDDTQPFRTQQEQDLTSPGQPPASK